MMESSHIAAANDDRLAEHGAVEVAGAEPLCLCCAIVAEQFTRARRELVELRQMCDELDDIFEKWQEDDDGRIGSG